MPRTSRFTAEVGKCLAIDGRNPLTPPPRRELLQCNVFAYMPGYGCGRDAVYLSTMPPGPGI